MKALGSPARPTSSSDAASERHRLPRSWRKVITAVVALIVAFGALTAWLLVWPARGMPARVSAIVLLAGPGYRMPVALRLASEHRAAVLVVSQGSHGYGSPCPPPLPGVKIICFDPNPGNTRGEAEFVGQLADRYHWTSITLVTSRAQDTRARILVRRCFGGSIYVTTTSLPWDSWPYQIAYAWGAIFKALVLYRAC